MNAKETETSQTGALGRGLDSLMTSDETKHASATHDQPADRPLGRDIAAVSGLIAGGAAGTIAVATFVLLGVKAVLGMERSR